MDKLILIQLIAVIGCAHQPAPDGEQGDSTGPPAEVCPGDLVPADTVLDIEETGQELEGGWYVPVQPHGPSQAGFVEGAAACVVACDLTVQSLCTTEDRSCIFCGSATRHECAAFLAAC